MADKVFLDTGGLIALINSDEGERHKLAVNILEELFSLKCEFFTTDHVLEELITLLRCREKLPVRNIFRFLHNLYVHDLNVIEVSRERFGNALAIMYKYKDHFFSMTDCLSFLAMREYKISEAFTTDKHFEIAGFRKLL